MGAVGMGMYEVRDVDEGDPGTIEIFDDRIVLTWKLADGRLLVKK